MFQYTAEEAIGQDVRFLIPPELQAQENEIIARIRRGERIESFETVRVRKDGTRFDLSLTISPIKSRDGTIVGASVVAHFNVQARR